MKKNNKKGFTLVELVIVVAVMAVLVAVAIPTVGSIKASADSAVSCFSVTLFCKSSIEINGLIFLSSTIF